MMIRSFILVIVLVIFGCTSRPTEQNKIEEKENKTSTAPMYQVVITENRGGFGYQILKDGKLVIDQPTIPAIQGNQFFSTREKAQKTAEIKDFISSDMSFPKSNDTIKTLHFHQEKVHDFAWFAEKNSSDSYFDNHKNIYQNAI